MLRYLVILIAVLALLTGAAVASGQGPITITRSDAVPTFQESVRFSAEAQSDSTITSATLHFKLADQNATNTVDVAIAPGRLISAEHSWDLTGADLHRAQLSRIGGRSKTPPVTPPILRNAASCMRTRVSPGRN